MSQSQHNYTRGMETIERIQQEITMYEGLPRRDDYTFDEENNPNSTCLYKAQHVLFSLI